MGRSPAERLYEDYFQRHQPHYAMGKEVLKNAQFNDQESTFSEMPSNLRELDQM